MQGFSIYLIITYSKYHHAAFSRRALEWSGNVSKQYNKVEYYFQLQKTNELLVKENQQLLNAQKQNFAGPDTLKKIALGPSTTDSLESHRKWLYLYAKVTQQSTISQSNYVIINRGVKQGMREDMGVLDPNNGVVGRIMEVSDNFSAVMSLLHKDSKVSARLYKYPEIAGTIVWDGKTPNIVQLTGIPKSLKVVKGDSVITTNLSPTFPPGCLVGTVEEVLSDKSSNHYLIRVKTVVNFFNVQFVYAIDNLEGKEIEVLENKLKKKNQ